MKRTAHAELELAAAPEAVMALLQDHTGYADWLPGLSRSKLLVQEGDIAAVEIEAHGYFSRPVSFELVRTGPQELMFQQTGQLGESGLSGTVTVATAGERTRVEAEASLYTPIHHLGTRRRLGEALRHALSALADHIEHQGAGARTTGRERRLVLQVRRLEGALEIWYKGQVFTTHLEPRETPP